MKRIAIIGASSLGQQLKHWFSTLNNHFEFTGFYDDFSEAGGEIRGKTAAVIPDYLNGSFDSIAIGVGYKAANFRTSIRQKLQDAKIPLATFIHPTAYVDQTAKIGAGCILLPHVRIDQCVTLEANCFLSMGASISHHSTIGADCYLAPSSVICGGCSIGCACFIGANTTVRDGIAISDKTTIGCGSVVVKNIENAGTYCGNPARRLST